MLALGAVGVIAHAWVATEGALGRIAWVVDLQSTSDPLYRAWTAVLPDYLVENAATWPLHWAWTALLVAAAALPVRGERARARTTPIGRPSVHYSSFEAELGLSRADAHREAGPCRRLTAASS